MRDDPNSVMIFAAGFGTRMGALTKDRPKPLIEVGGETLIDRTLSLVEAFGPDKIVVNLHYKADMLRQHLKCRDVALIEEVPDILDTGGGLKAALPYLGANPVFTIYSDAVWVGPNPLDYLVKSWAPEKMDALLLCVPISSTHGHSGSGDFLLDEEGRLTRGPGEVFSGLQIIKSESVARCKARSFSLNEVWTQAEQDGRLFGLSYPGAWCDVGNPSGIALAEDMLGLNHA